MEQSALKYIYYKRTVTNMHDDMINHSISIKPSDEVAQVTVKEIKAYCKSRGISFSFIVLKLLKQYKDEIITGKL
jgi:hypothetical protein